MSRTCRHACYDHFIILNTLPIHIHLENKDIESSMILGNDLKETSIKFLKCIKRRWSIRSAMVADRPPRILVEMFVNAYTFFKIKDDIKIVYPVYWQLIFFNRQKETKFATDTITSDGRVQAASKKHLRASFKCIIRASYFHKKKRAKKRKRKHNELSSR